MRHIFIFLLLSSSFLIADNRPNTSALQAAHQLMTGVEQTALQEMSNNLLKSDKDVETFVKNKFAELDESVKGGKSELENRIREMSAQITGGKMNPQHKDWEAFRVKFLEVSRELGELEKGIKDAKEQIKKIAAEAKMTEDQIALKNKFGSLAKTLADMDLASHKLKWNDSVSDYHDKLLDARVKYMALERAFDSKVMGGYVQAKLTRFANSDVFCKAAKQCGIDDKSRVPLELDPLFFDDTGAPRANDGMKNTKSRSTIELEGHQ